MSAHFYPLTVAEIVPETAEANSIRFDIPHDLRETFAFKAGQHLTLKATSTARRCAAIIRCAPRRTSRTGW